MADWQRPAGVAAGTWDYIRARHIAADYDEFHAGHGMLRFIERIVADWVKPPGRVLDCGSGTGRDRLRVGS